MPDFSMKEPSCQFSSSEDGRRDRSLGLKSEGAGGSP